MNKDYLRTIFSCFSKTFTLIIPKKKNRWVFGAWYGNSASDNSKAIYDYITLNYPDIETIWFVNKPEKYSLSGKVVKRNSLKAIYYASTAQVAIFNQGYQDFATLNLLGGCFSAQMWHGVAWKKIGHDSKNESRFVKAIYKYAENYSLYIAPSEEYKHKLSSAFFVKEDKILSVGQPRNEIFFNPDGYTANHNLVSNKLGVNNKKIIAYLPTFRDKREKTFSFFQEGIIEKITELGKELGFIIVEKSHFVDQNRQNSYEKENDVVFGCPDVDTQQLLAGADMLITDYSSCYFDFVLTDRPIIHFIYDYDYYKNDDRGLYYSADEAAAGQCVYSEDLLFSAIDDNLRNQNKYSERRQQIRNRFLNYENINNSQIIVDEVFTRLGKKI